MILSFLAEGPLSRTTVVSEIGMLRQLQRHEREEATSATKRIDKRLIKALREKAV